MKAPRTIAILAALLLIGFLAIYFARKNEPTYKGRTIGDWLSAANRSGNSQSKEYSDGRTAIKALGTSAIPTLLKYLVATNSTFTLQVNSLLNRIPLIHFHLATAHEKHEWAYFGFGFLERDGLPAVPALSELAKHPNSEVRAWTFSCLYSICPFEKQTYLPILEQFLHDPDRNIRLDAARTIRNLFPAEAERLGVYKDFSELQVPLIAPVSSSGATNSEVKK